jgi:hypothetical protein
MSKPKSLPVDAPTGAPGSLPSALLQALGIAPGLGESEVRQWILAALAGKKDTVSPPSNVVTSLRDKLVTLYVAYPLGVRGGEAKRAPTAQSAAIISKALSTLRREIPVWISLRADELKGQPLGGTHSTTKEEAVLALITAIDKAMRSQVFGIRGTTRTRRGRRHEQWHAVAQYLKPEVVSALKACGVRRPGFGHSEAPAIMLLKSALGWLGVNLEESTIVKAMSSRAD